MPLTVLVTPLFDWARLQSVELELGLVRGTPKQMVGSIRSRRLA